MQLIFPLRSIFVIPSVLSCYRNLLLTLLVLLGTSTLYAQTNEVQQVELLRRGQQMSVRFLLTQPPDYVITENLQSLTLVVKFRNTRPNFKDGGTVRLFNDEQIEGVRFLEIENETWAQFKLRVEGMTFEVRKVDDANVLEIAFRPPVEIERLPDVSEEAQYTLQSITHDNGTTDRTRLIFGFNDLPRLMTLREQDGAVVNLRFPDTLPQPGLEGFTFSDPRTQLEGLQVDVNQTFARLELLGADARVETERLENPARWQVDIFGEAQAVDQSQDISDLLPGDNLSKDEQYQMRVERIERKNRETRLRNSYQLAERAFRRSNYTEATQGFDEVYKQAKLNFADFEDPLPSLSVQALFRKADTLYTMLERRRGKNYHTAIDAYKLAIRIAQETGQREDLVPHALFRVARSYQKMSFSEDADLHFELLRNGYPTAMETVESNFWKAMSHMERRNWEQAIQDFNAYLQASPNPKYLAATTYQLAQAHYQLERFISAREYFDQARELDPDYPLGYPMLLFHMGETYYENADYVTAREVFKMLLNRYPDADFTKFVALRLGDFLRDEGKEDEAIEAYKNAISSYTREIAILGKLRIANLQSMRPYGGEHLEAVKVYDEIIELYPDAPQAEEAMLRKGLTLTLYGDYAPAISALEAFQQKHPQSLYVQRGVVQENIDENLKGLIDRHYQKQDDLALVATYRDYKAKYLLNFRFVSTMLQVAMAHKNLGLYDDALDLFKFLESRARGTMLELIRLQMAQTMLDKGSLPEARDQYAKFLQQYPESEYDAAARIEFAEVYRQEREFEKAELVLKQAIERYDQDEDPLRAEVTPELYFHLGQLYEEMGRYAEAGEAYRSTVRSYSHPVNAPDSPDYVVKSHFLAADMLAKVGADEEALQQYDLAMATYEGRTDDDTKDRLKWALYQSGTLMARMGQEAEALEVFKKLVDDPEGEGQLWQRLAAEQFQALSRQLSFQNYLKQ
jgi:tetratricopeptide (TPR) repeat protein